MPEPLICGNCGGIVEPFGQFGQLFHYDVIGLLCLPCARVTIPSHVAEAERMETELQKKDAKS